MAVDNRLLGEFNLEGIPPAPRGVPQIEVKFDVDQNGILNVSAKDLGTGKEASVRIEQSSGLSETEIERMRKDAESHAEEDRRKFELVEARNQADQMCYQLEKMMKENAEKLADADKEPLKQAIEKVRAAAKGDDVQAIKSSVGELEQASHALSKVLYEKAQRTRSAGCQPAVQNFRSAGCQPAVQISVAQAASLRCPRLVRARFRTDSRCRLHRWSVRFSVFYLRGCGKIGTGTFATADFPVFSPFSLGASPIFSQPLRPQHAEAFTPAKNSTWSASRCSFL
jgi:hypothetical protein